MAAPIAFNLLPPPTSTDNEIFTRLGDLQFPNRARISTPHYIGLSSRGAIPHLSQDMMRDNTFIKGVFAALEDYIERDPSSAPLLSLPCTSNESPLRRFIALQENALLILGPRRVPPISCPASNTYSAISTLTSVGFGTLEVEDYVAAVVNLRPDFALGMGDVISPGDAKSVRIGLKRKEKMAERTFTWLRALVNGLDEKKEEEGNSVTVLLAPILPIESELQRDYLSELYENPKWAQTIGGLVLYDNASIEAIPSETSHLLRLSLSCPTNPHALLHAVSLGIDLFVIPFINEATEGGIALSFSFQSQPQASTSKHPLAYDMWLPTHSKDVSALVDDCKCYACTHHHKAYIHHLLSAKEMLAWVLLQIHNHYIMDEFFAEIRSSIGKGSFETLQNTFTTTYESELPVQSGQGPRIRGYQHQHTGPTKSKTNPSSYRKLSDDVHVQKPPTAASAAIEDSEAQIGPVPELPGMTGQELEAVGFGEVDVDG